MNPTEILMNEHRVIEQVLNCLERMVEKAREAGRLERQPALDAIAFIRQFADKCHHAKEENQLFVLMAERGVPVEGGPIGVMLQDHQYGRDCVGVMAASLEEAAQGDTAALKTFGLHAEAFIDMLRDHIVKEDRVLYPMANDRFSPEDQQELLARFDAVEREEIGREVQQKYLDIAAALGAQYGVVLQSDSATYDCFMCGGHRCG